MRIHSTKTIASLASCDLNENKVESVKESSTSYKLSYFLGSPRSSPYWTRTCRYRPTCPCRAAPARSPSHSSGRSRRRRRRRDANSNKNKNVWPRPRMKKERKLRMTPNSQDIDKNCVADPVLFPIRIWPHQNIQICFYFPL